MCEQFVYAVARVRAKELSLLSEADVNRLLACETYPECLNVLRDKGWGDDIAETVDYHELIAAEEAKLWRFIFELVPDKSAFNVVLLPVDFHNLKAAVKGYITNSLSDDLFMAVGTLDKDFLTKCVEKNNFSDLPTIMAEAAKTAFGKLLHTGDGQLCDNIIDKALLEAINLEGKTSKNSLIRAYSELMVASSNIKVAIRCQNLNKNFDFLKSVLVECQTLDIEKLAEAAIAGKEALCDYLVFTPYEDAVPFVRESLQQFEFWRDNKIMELICAEKYDSFSIAPIIAYILARQNEFKVVRVILSGKLNRIENDLIKERLRKMYA